MAFSLVNNVTRIANTNNLIRTNNQPAKSPDERSSRLPTQPNADESRALVLSEEQRTQITELQSALDNVNEATRAAQTGQGALNEINQLLGRARSLAASAANDEADEAVRQNNQAQISQILSTINNIAASQISGQQLFAGAAAPSGGLLTQIGIAAVSSVDEPQGLLGTDALGRGAGKKSSALSAIDVSQLAGAQDALHIIDQAMNQVTSARDSLLAFQDAVVEGTANDLRAALEKVVTPESAIRNTDVAIELAASVKSQVQLQPDTTVQGNTNQAAQLIAGLLRE